MKYYIIAGEASGDLHGANLIKAIKAKDPEAELRCWGGDLMQKQGGFIVKHIHDLAFMGFIEVAANFNTILKNLKFCKKDIADWNPDVLVLLDYPGFNLRIAEYAHDLGFKVIYYISPQIWAWKQSRVHKIKKVVDRMLVILPFEKEFYERFDYKVDFVGHPLLDEIENGISIGSDWKTKNKLDAKPIIALLPGSRKQEISTMLPIMLETVKEFPDFQFVIAAAPSVSMSYYAEFIQSENVHIIQGQTYHLLTQAKAALVTSGTATLETALFGVPEIVCYKGSRVSYLIAKRLIKVKFISLVNLVMDREVVKELIQKELTGANLISELKKILHPEGRKKMLSDFTELKQKLGGKGASDKAAGIIVDFASGNH